VDGRGKPDHDVEQKGALSARTASQASPAGSAA
jgi:hypothetical protein